MDNLSTKQQFILAAGLPTLGFALAALGLVTGSGSISIWIGTALLPCAAGIWFAIQASGHSNKPTEEMVDLMGQIQAMDKSQAVIEFNLDGTIITANENFLSTVGYRLEEIQGQHHKMFVDSEYATSSEYKEFWGKLNRGEFQAAEYRRFGKDGKEVWIQASYNPLFDHNNRPYKVVKYATDITEQKMQAADSQGQISAIGKSQAVIEFNMDGTIISANDNFLGAVGYSLNEIQGQHHKMFVEPGFAESVEYKEFWNRLNRGDYEAAEYKRIAKGGREIWIQASYNPIMDLSGKPIKVVKYATDITAQVAARDEAERIAKTAQALEVCQASVMMADLDMNIVYVNESAFEMLRNRETELKSALPRFNSHDLVGENVDIFHKDPSHQRGMIQHLSDVYKTDIDVAGLTFGLIATPWVDTKGNRIGTIVEWQDKTEALALERETKRIADENARVKQALDNVATATMIADPDFNIIYMNGSAGKMMKNAEPDIRNDLPNFDASKLIGTNIDGFHKNPSHQRGLVNGLKGTFESELKIGGRTMSIVANSIEVEGERLGTVVEWVDRTAEVAIEKEINHLVEAANSGDFTIQLPEEGKEGFFLNLTTGLNSLTATANEGLSDVLRVINSMASGDLTNKIEEDYEGIFGALKDSVNSTIAKLLEVITEIRNASVTLSSGASEIATGNADLSKRTEEQASSLEETASSMEEMTSVVKQGAENSRDANELSQTAKKKATDGGVVVQKAVTAMEEINKSSKEIADIIGVIEEIAFQTNLLALNAAVEAARAGEQGRGFAVVAGEVRNLAQRSADASKQIKELIRNSETKVSEGSNLVNESGKTLADIEEAVVKVSAMIEDISAGSEEQTSGIEQVNTAVAQMDEMTQQNAALVEEASASSEAVSDRASGLAKMMDFFNTGESSIGAGSTQHLAPSAPMQTAQRAQPMQTEDDDEWQEF